MGVPPEETSAGTGDVRRSDGDGSYDVRLVARLTLVVLVRHISEEDDGRSVRR
jgi:hypothetical protein